MLRYFRHSLKTHVIVLLMAGLVWSIARNSVAEKETLRNAITFQVVLPAKDDGDIKRYDFVEVQQVGSITLDVQGPTQRVETLVRNVGDKRKLVYKLELEKEELEKLEPNPVTHRVLLQVPLERFAMQTSALIPPDLTVQFSQPKEQVFVVLEEFVKVPITFQASDIIPISGYKADIQATTQAFAYGPWSRVSKLPFEGDKVVFELSKIDLAALFQSEEAINEATRTPATEVIPIRLHAGIDVRNAIDESISSVAVDMSLSESAARTMQRAQVPVHVKLPLWLAEIGPVITLTDKTLEIQLQVGEGISSEMIAENSEVLVDLTTYSKNWIEQKSKHSAQDASQRVLTHSFVTKLVVNSQAFEYQLPEGVIQDAYVPLDVTLTWTEGS